MKQPQRHGSPASPTAGKSGAGPTTGGGLDRPRIAADMALAAALSTLLALLFVALLEASRTPAGERGVAAVFSLSFFLASGDALSTSWALAIAHLVGAALVAARHLLGPGRPPAAALAAAPLFGVALCHAKLVEYPPFAWYPPFIAFHAGALALLFACALLFPLPPGTVRRRRRAALVGQRILPSAAVALFVVLHLLNYALYRDRYPTLHASVLMTSFLLLAAGLFPLVFGFLRARRSRALGLAAFAVTASLLAVSSPLSDLPAARAVAPDYLRFTVLGQEVSRVAWEREFARELAAAGQRAHDPDGVSRFERFSGLPALPDDFRLLDHHILLVTVETFRADETSMSDPGRDLTPRLLAYAQRDAHWFTRAYVGSANTLQSIASLFAMAYPSASGLHLYNPRWDGYLPAKVPTAVEHLRRAGYDTFWVGYTGACSEDGVLDWCWPRFDRVTVHPEDEDVLTAAKEALTARRRNDRRFFGWVFFPAPHGPFRAHFDDMPAGTRRDRYRQELRYVDGIIHRLLEHLAAEGLEESTIVIIHGDHGEEFGERGKTGHDSLYSECSIVPLIVRIPGMDGRRSDDPTSIPYLFPWLFSSGDEDLRAIARTRMERVFGPVLEATGGAVVAELFGNAGTRSLLACRDHHFHHDFASRRSELFDLGTDPGERHNLLGRDRESTERMLERFARYLAVRRANLDIGFSEGTLDQLESPGDRQDRARRIARLRKAGEDEQLAALRREHWHVQREAARMLLARDDLGREAIDELIMALVSDNLALRARVRTDMAEAASRLIDDQLFAAMRDDNPRREVSYGYGDGKRRTLAEAAMLMLEQRGAAALP